VLRPLLISLSLATAAHASTLEDMDLRSNVEASIRGNAATANLHLKIDVRDAVAIPEGVVRDLQQADDVVSLASKVKGIVGVDRAGLRLEYAGPGDESVGAAIRRSISEIPRYTSATIAIDVASGVVTLTGAMKHASWRGDLRKLCGAVQGVIDVVECSIRNALAVVEGREPEYVVRL